MSDAQIGDSAGLSSVVIDWAQIGLRAGGTDLAPLGISSVLWAREWDASALPELSR